MRTLAFAACVALASARRVNTDGKGAVASAEMASAAMAVDADLMLQGSVLTLCARDCGDDTTPVKVTKLNTDTLTVGETFTVVGTGMLKEGQAEIKDGAYTINLEAGPGGVLKKEFKDDIGKHHAWAFPKALFRNTGQLVWNAVKLPIKPNIISEVSTDIKIASGVPSQFAGTKITVKAHDSKGKQLLCMKMTTAKKKTKCERPACECDDGSIKVDRDE